MGVYGQTAASTKQCNKHKEQHHKNNTVCISGGFRGVRGVQMHPPLAATNVFLYITARVHRMIMQLWNASATARHSYTLTYQFLADLQTFD